MKFEHVTRFSSRLSIAAAVAASVALAGTAAAQTDSGVRLEGSGKHRRDADAMQLKPFDHSVWSHLSQWSGEAPTAESTKNKPILIVTWSGWNTLTHRSVELAQRLHAKHSGDGLVVVGIHNPRDFSSAAAAAEKLGVKFPYAADEQGKARAALNVDNDPDFFLVDRAGNVRFADIETSSVERAVTLVMGETAEQAASVPGAVKDAARQRELDRLKTADTKGLFKPGMALTVEFPDPADEAYQSADWPKMIEKTGYSEFDQMVEKVKKESPTFALPDDGWVTPVPVTRGRITAVYMINPLLADFRGQIPIMNRIQDALARDLVVVAAPLTSDPNTMSSMSEDEKQKKQREELEAFSRLRQTQVVNHAMVATPAFPAGIDKYYYFIESMRERGIVLLLSSDGRVRWIGNPHFDQFRTAVDQMIRVDPGVQARRRAEDIKVKSGAR